MRKHPIIKITLLLSASLLLSYCSKYEKVADDLDFLKYEYFTCDVVRVADGESFFCQPPDMYMDKIRLIGVSVPPESEDEAKKYCESILRRGTLVKIEPGSESRKETGDIPAYVFVPGGRMLNVLLIEKGYAVLVKEEAGEKYVNQFEEAARNASAEENEKKEKPPWLR